MFDLFTIKIIVSFVLSLGFVLGLIGFLWESNHGGQ